MAPIEKDLILKEKLKKMKKNGLNNYHRQLFLKLKDL